MVQGTLHAMGTNPGEYGILTRGSFGNLLLEVPGPTGEQTPGPDGSLNDTRLCSRALAACIFSREFLHYKHYPGAQ